MYFIKLCIYLFVYFLFCVCFVFYFFYFFCGVFFFGGGESGGGVVLLEGDIVCLFWGDQGVVGLRMSFVYNFLYFWVESEFSLLFGNFLVIEDVEYLFLVFYDFFLCDFKILILFQKNCF